MTSRFPSAWQSGLKASREARRAERLTSGSAWSSPLAATLICFDDEGNEHHFDCANGFVSRVVSAVFHSDQMGCYSDARRVMEIMNGAANGGVAFSQAHGKADL